jgi:hypothetical protein
MHLHLQHRIDLVLGDFGPWNNAFPFTRRVQLARSPTARRALREALTPLVDEGIAMVEVGFTIAGTPDEHACVEATSRRVLALTRFLTALDF